MKLTPAQVTKLMKDAGVSREELAKRCHVSVHTVRGWEGAHPPGGLASVFIETICAAKKQKARA